MAVSIDIPAYTT